MHNAASPGSPELLALPLAGAVVQEKGVRRVRDAWRNPFSVTLPQARERTYVFSAISTELQVLLPRFDADFNQHAAVFWKFYATWSRCLGCEIDCASAACNAETTFFCKVHVSHLYSSDQARRCLLAARHNF